MCLKWDFSGIEGNYTTICKQLQIRIISENIFSLILIVYRHRKLGYPYEIMSVQRASPWLKKIGWGNKTATTSFENYHETSRCTKLWLIQEYTL